MSFWHGFSLPSFVLGLLTLPFLLIGASIFGAVAYATGETRFIASASFRQARRNRNVWWITWVLDVIRYWFCQLYEYCCGRGIGKTTGVSFNNKDGSKTEYFRGPWGTIKDSNTY